MGIAYYNENDPYAAQWLRNLIAAGLIAYGHVDDRSITEVRPDDLRGYTQCHFFAGIAGWSRALRLAGWADDRPVWTGSCPCQPFSVAGKRKGFEDGRHLWPIWFDLIKVCRPPVVFGEQVAAAATWLGLVRGDLEGVGYAVGAIPVEAASAGADHLRDRLWFVADSDGSAVRDEPGRRSGPNGAGAAIDGDDSQGGNLGLADCRGPQAGQSAAKAVGHRSAAIATGRPGVAHGDACGQGLPVPEYEALFGAGRREEGRAASESSGTVGLADTGHPRSSRSGSDAQRQGALIESGDGSREEVDWVIGADGKARRVGTCFRSLVDGLPTFLAGLRPECYAEAKERVREYGQATSTGSSEVLRTVWERVLSQPATYEAMGEPAGVRGAEILLPFLRELGCRSKQSIEADSALPSAQELDDAMRGLRFGGASPRAPLRWQHPEQRAIEHSDALHVLSWLLAQSARATWEAHRRQNAKAIRLLEAGVPARVGKLRAFGNAIDPRPAAAFITAAFPDLARAA